MPPNIDAIVTAANFVVPGYLFLLAFNAVIVREIRDATRLVLEAVAASVALMTARDLLLELFVGGLPHTTLGRPDILANAGLLVAAPLLGNCVGRAGLKWPRLHKVLGVRHTIPKAWDWLFASRQECFVRITLVDGSVVAGRFGAASFASSYPSEEDIFVEVAYGVGDDMAIGEAAPSSGGFWVSKSQIRCLEVLECQERSTDDQETSGGHALGAGRVPTESGGDAPRIEEPSTPSTPNNQSYRCQTDEAGK